MRRSLPVILVIVLALLNTQCDPGTFSLFPNFLTSVTNITNAGDFFQHMNGERFYFDVMQGGSPGGDYVYIVQTLPDGNGRVAVYNDVCVRLAAFTSPDVGGCLIPVETGYHQIGRVVVDLADFGMAPIIGTFPGDKNSPVVFDGSTGYEFWMDYQAVGAQGLVTRHVSYNNVAHRFDLAPTTNTAIQVGVLGRRYALEPVDSKHPSNPTRMIFRDTANNQAFYADVDLPPSAAIPLMYLPAPDVIVPGTVRWLPDGSFVAQTPDGYLRRFWVDSDADTKTYSDSLNGYLLAYGYNDSMYAFNPSSLSLFKCRAWWRDNYD